MVKIDVKDRKILYHLLNNSRQSLSSIGKKVGLSKHVVGYRMKRLEETGVIVNYMTYMRPIAFEFFMARFYYNLQFISPEVKKEIIDHFIQSNNTTLVSETEGSYDLQVNMFTNCL